MNNFYMNKQMISWSADLLSQIFSQILESLRSPFIIEEDVLAIIEKLCYFGSYSDITAISELLLDFMLSAKEEESNRYKSLDMNIYFVEKLGIPVAYNLFSEKLLQLVKKHKHTNGFNLDKLVTTALNKLMIDLDIDMLRVVLPYFDDFFQLTHDDPKFKDVFGSKTKKSQPNNYLESYFSEICKLIYDFKNGNDEQFLKGLIPKLKADLEGNRHFINIKFSRMYQGFLSHLNNRLECILASQISRARTEDNLFESIYKQSEFYLDEPLPKETPQLRYFELFPYQYRLTKPQKMRLASLLHRMSVESRGLVLGCVSNNTIRGVVLNTVQQAVLNDEIQHVFNMLGNEAFNRCLAVTFHDVKGESVFNFQNTHRFVFKIVFNSNEELQASRFKGCESRIDNSEVVRRTYLCYWHPDWKVDEDKIQSVVQRGGREEAREVKETRVPVSVKVEKPEKTDSVEKSVSAPALKSVTLTPQSSDKATNGTEKEKEQEKEKENTNKPNGKLVEEKPSEQEIPSAWLQKIPIKKSSEPPKQKKVEEVKTEPPATVLAKAKSTEPTHTYVAKIENLDVLGKPLMTKKRLFDIIKKHSFSYEDLQFAKEKNCAFIDVPQKSKDSFKRDLENLGLMVGPGRDALMGYKNTRIYGFERYVLAQSFADINVKVDEITVNFDEEDGHIALIELRSATCK